MQSTESSVSSRPNVKISDFASDLRIQIRTDPRYQDFILGSELRNILGYEIKVASLEDVLKGKVWAYTDETRRRSKRQKDIADICRIIETFPNLAPKLPHSLREQLQLE